MAMNQKDHKLWAREMMIAMIDDGLALLKDGDAFQDFDDQVVLQKERNRIAKFLGVPERELFK